MDSQTLIRRLVDAQIAKRIATLESAVAALTVTAPKTHEVTE